MGSAQHIFIMNTSLRVFAIVSLIAIISQQAESREYKPVVVRTQQGYWKRQLGLEEDPDEISERSDSEEEEVIITRHKLRPDTTAVRKPIIGPVNRNFKQIINKLSPETKGKVLIARADEDIEVEPQQTLAKVIQHNGEDSPYVRTVVIQNTAQAFKAFGVKNIPKRILDSWARVKRRSFEPAAGNVDHNDLGDDDSTDQYI